MNTVGRVFSIEEFSTFDGPGIRVTVFLKGCPLRCMWCHNPEGQSFETEYIRSPNGCLHCGACLEMGKHLTGTACLVAQSVNICPNNLVRRCGDDMTVEELVRKLENKFWMLDSTGGGVTFSGGEPLCQSEFLLRCLKALKGKTHRAIQTSGFAGKDVFKRSLENCDYMLFDLKHMDPQQHKKYTGADNTQILENYKILAGSGMPFITRIPLVPGVNDTADNITRTAEFMAGLGVKEIELLPYNKAAGAKYKLLDRLYVTDFDQTVEPQPRTDIFGQYGIEVRIL